jgi:hypothetical protein
MKGYKGFIKAKNYDWDLHPDAERLLQKEINRFLRNNKYATKLAKAMKDKTSTRFFDWIDHMVIPESRVDEKILKKLGFKLLSQNTPINTKAFKHHGTIWFPILITQEDITEIALKPENIEHIAKKGIKGRKYAPLRKAILKKEGQFILSAVERRGTSDFIVKDTTDIADYKKAYQTFAKRKRKFKTDKEGLKEVKKLTKKVLKKLSPSRTADAFFRNERAYWESRNGAGKLQKKRQDSLGLGWGNHDHHTYRSSREHFVRLMEIFELMGYFTRERFYAGEKAGWGAQVLEHPDCDIVVFADTDITKAEKDRDFAHLGLKHQNKLGTVGLWIGLHGESILQSGLHHLEARFDFHKLSNDLNKKKSRVMKPFSNFPFLKQAFTEGERWDVEKSRVDKLLKENSITQAQHDEFLNEGAIGSHLENLQRKQGFKGFNQTSVSAIIKITDPRKQHFHRGA